MKTAIMIAALSLGSMSWAAANAVSNLVAQADTLYPLREDGGQMAKALALYEQAIASDPRNTEAVWKASRAAWWAGTRAHERQDQLKFFKKGIDWGEQAIAQEPNSGEAHFWLGGNYGSYGHQRGILSSLFLVPKVRREMAETIRLTPDYLGGGGYRLLGIMDYKIPSFAGGSKKRAGENLDKARAVDPSNPVTRYYYAEYLYDIGKKEESLAQLRSIKTLHVPEDQMPELRMIQKERQSLAKKLGA